MSSLYRLVNFIHLAVLYTPSTYFFWNWEFVPFGHFHPIPLFQPLAATHLISFPMSLFLKCNWTTALCLFLVHNPVTLYFYTFQNDLVTVCHPTKTLHSYGLCSPHCTFHACDSFFTSSCPSPVPLFLSHFTPSGDCLFVLCIYDSDSLFLCFFICFIF